MSEIRLSDWAKQNNIDYKTAWNQNRAGTLPIKTKTNANGRIFAVIEDQKKEKKMAEFATPTLAGRETSTASTRRNVSATATPTNKYANIEQGIEPGSALHARGGTDSGAGMFPVAEAIHLCQKAFYNFSIIRNILDAMEDFSVSKLYFQGGTTKSRNFFENLFESLNIFDFQGQFFREYYRSGNVFIYRFETAPTDADLVRLNKVYGSNAAKMQLPSRYMIINPYDVGAQANIVFGSNVIFFKRLNGYEIHRLRVQETPEEVMFFKSLPKISQDAIMAGSGTVIIPLNPERLYAVFLRKSDYEPMAIPMIFPVLKDIEWKQEMKNIDMAVSRTMNNCVLLVKMGYQSKDGDYMFDSKAADAMRGLFESESVGKTLVADFTTEVTHVIPTIGDFLDPKKYQIVNEDIKTGLNYVLTGTDSKFANQFISVQLFVQRLQQAREVFINKFLMPEIKRISGLMGFQSYPTPKFEDINLKDDIEFNKIAVQMASLGILTAPELLESIETGRIPTKEESLENQAEFRTLKDKGFYDPLIGGPYDQQKLTKLTASLAPEPVPGGALPGKSGFGPQPKTPAPTGRPTGINTPQSTKKVSITKGSENEEVEQYSLEIIKKNMILASQLRTEVEKHISKSRKIKKLSDEQKKICEDISEVIMANKKSSDWLNSVEEFVKSPVNSNDERLIELDAIAARHGLNPNIAVYLLDAKRE